MPKKISKEKNDSNLETNSIDIEELLKKLDKITETMSSDKCTLEEAFNLYKEGIELTKEAKDNIEKIEGKIKILEEE